jgi:putative flippase GtrA
MARPPGGATATSWQWVRHYIASIVATAVDYTTMVTLVELAHRDPVSATAVGAFAGAVANFTLGRVFTYAATDHPIGAQAARYIVVSAGSLALNAAGEYLFAKVLGLQYIVARLVTSFVVSTAWNYPLQRFYVFSRRPSQ